MKFVVAAHKANLTFFCLITTRQESCGSGVTLDYLVADGELRNLDKKTLQRLEDISKLPTEDRNNIFYTLDNLIKAAKLKAI